MKLFSRALVSAAMVALPVAAQAQAFTSTMLTVNSQTIAAGAPTASGGQFSVTGTGLGSYLAYCIDRSRNISGFGAVNAVSYRIYTFSDYVAFASAAPAASGFNNSAFLTELRQFAVNAGIIATDPLAANRNNAQNQTWDWFQNAGNQGGPASLVGENSWRVLVSEEAASQTDFRNGVAGFQTMIVSVPEPSTYVLMFSGLALVGVAARRRNKVS